MSNQLRDLIAQRIQQELANPSLLLQGKPTIFSYRRAGDVAIETFLTANTEPQSTLRLPLATEKLLRELSKNKQAPRRVIDDFLAAFKEGEEHA